MNINQFFDQIGETPPLSLQAVVEMLDRRSKTFRGFAETEARHGLLQLDLPLSDSKAQDSVRLLVYRFTEEIFESHNASERAHVLEEAVDAINYLWSLAFIEEAWQGTDTSRPDKLNFQSYLLDGLGLCLNYSFDRPQRWGPSQMTSTNILWLEAPSGPLEFWMKNDLSCQALDIITDWRHSGTGTFEKPGPVMIWTLSQNLFSVLSPRLRNRAWMHETQQTDFAYQALMYAILLNTFQILKLFPDWQTFWQFYTAKDRVLQFRLTSKY